MSATAAMRRNPIVGATTSTAAAMRRVGRIIGADRTMAGMIGRRPRVMGTGAAGPDDAQASEVIDR
jgi:hypothetical protein